MCCFKPMDNDKIFFYKVYFLVFKICCFFKIKSRDVSVVKNGLYECITVHILILLVSMICEL